MNPKPETPPEPETTSDELSPEDLERVTGGAVQPAVDNSLVSFNDFNRETVAFKYDISNVESVGIEEKLGQGK